MIVLLLVQKVILEEYCTLDCLKVAKLVLMKYESVELTIKSNLSRIDRKRSIWMMYSLVVKVTRMLIRNNVFKESHGIYLLAFQKVFRKAIECSTSLGTVEDGKEIKVLRQIDSKDNHTDTKGQKEEKEEEGFEQRYKTLMRCMIAFLRVRQKAIQGR
ncbi:hypothetical protein PHYBLDRAFT_70100 [Phycomyces blakesleeanus NRRL 1555(-)]|uniref:Uncharacterized protein n=1 Tax=Phycomyces blakesleeanus (strain ATCC 8743b / DSM 1359 / FGSC 10004 / NBRC 33097 / NRRL 1555) TaxID=763407 RepID=A0A162PP11_PHYB8|nr:hypothetical protein PHYBLDRAFT_70100 [Phycomyces blakesleeanus NRRL 1555(-)]OAD71566.1 hypothetical protein PHYBLDRAFT_70100 [Phycomyces blakesleeanus NRRL 1555(-)]|eukprot:XP_018289606.1 hypothetical protein PHYBLDRAFT_70100 [Phycomyces blakesleeanus NRRL 1555(-)]